MCNYCEYSSKESYVSVLLRLLLIAALMQWTLLESVAWIMHHKIFRDFISTLFLHNLQDSS